MKLPKRISPCPIIEAVVEIRFSSLLPKEAIYGVFYSRVKPLFQEIKNLPILKIPAQIRENTNDLLYQPYYQFKKQNLLVRLGPRVLAISNTNEYIGWVDFFEFIKKIEKEASEIGLIDKIERVGVRYINFFEGVIFDNINIEIKISQNNCSNKILTMRIEDVEENISRVLHISNNAQIKKLNKTFKGTVIDIDCIQTSLTEIITQSNIDEKIDIAHKKEKEYFYEILKKDFVNSLHPEYGD